MFNFVFIYTFKCIYLYLFFYLFTKYFLFFYFQASLDYRQEMLERAMSILHLHALRCLDDADERVRMAACSACCRLLARAALDAPPSSLGIGIGIGSGSGAGAAGDPEPVVPRLVELNDHDDLFFYYRGGRGDWVDNFIQFSTVVSYNISFHRSHMWFIHSSSKYLFFSTSKQFFFFHI